MSYAKSNARQSARKKATLKRSNIASTTSASTAEISSFNSTLSLSHTSNFYKSTAADKISDTSLSVSTSYKITESSSVDLQFSGTQDHQGLSESKLNDAFIGYSQKVAQLNKHTSLSGRVQATLPLSEDSYYRKQLLTKVSLIPSLNINMSELGAAGLNLYARLNFTKGFYKYETTTNGVSNINYQFSETFGAQYALTDKFGVGASFTLSQAFNYFNNQALDKFSMDQNVSYQFSEHVSGVLGHSNGGTVFKDNGVESNFEAFDEETSTFYSGVTLLFN
jgi:predicted ester cyclase